MISPTPQNRSFPRLYAAASLKRDAIVVMEDGDGSFPRLYAAASLKRSHPEGITPSARWVFRGFMPRPH